MIKKRLALSERNESKGFTLVEMLVVIAILSVFGVLILTIFTRTLRSGNKTQLLGVIKQNGQSVLENMDKTIRNSDRVICVSDGGKTIVTVKQGIYTNYRFIAQNDDRALNGYIIQETFPLPSSRPAGSDPSSWVIDFERNVCIDLLDSTRVQVLTDTNPQTGVSVESGTFTRVRSAGFRDQVTIKFELKPGKKVFQAIAGQIDAVSFQTTVQLR